MSKNYFLLFFFFGHSHQRCPHLRPCSETLEERAITVQLTGWTSATGGWKDSSSSSTLGFTDMLLCRSVLDSHCSWQATKLFREGHDRPFRHNKSVEVSVFYTSSARCNTVKSSEAIKNLCACLCSLLFSGLLPGWVHRECVARFSKVERGAKRVYSELQQTSSANGSGSDWISFRQNTNLKTPHSTYDLHLENDLNEFYCRQTWSHPQCLHPPA